MSASTRHHAPLNDPPVVTITSPAGGALFPVGPVSVQASFADAGAQDEHTCMVTWDIDQGTAPATAHPRKR